MTEPPAYYKQNGGKPTSDTSISQAPVRSLTAVLLFLRGVLMGTCDLVPGISGGTMALITGIYLRLMNAVKSFSPRLLQDIFRYLSRKDNPSYRAMIQRIKELDLLFLVPVIAGVAAAILLGSRVMTFFLHNYAVFTLSFFTGLILASTIIIYREIPSHSLLDILLSVLGLFCGVLLALYGSTTEGGASPVEITPSLPYIFFTGIVAISAMFLPGISGSFILLILGAYRFMLQVLHNMMEYVSFLVSFIAGAAIGVVVVPRVITYLFRKDRSKTLYFLLGLVLGCLTIPVKQIMAAGSLTAGELTKSIMLGALGMIFVLALGILPAVFRDKQ